MSWMVGLYFSASHGHVEPHYKDICNQYTEYVTRKYGEAIVVFHGYDGTSTKDMTHQR